jgi:hypothetical protein
VKTWLGICGALCVVGVVAFLDGCAGSQTPTITPDAAARAGAAQSKRFVYTGNVQLFKVPTGVTQIDVDASGARGAGVSGGDGGRVVAHLTVTPGAKIAIYVGGEGSSSAGGFNGGGGGGSGPGSTGYGNGGGGASDLRLGGSTLRHRVLVAAGGGGTGGEAGYGGKGGAGGGATGAAGLPGAGPSGGGGGGGSGGTQQRGGTGGAAGYGYYNYGAIGGDGSVGVGGTGGVGCVRSFCEGGGGGGAGGGYYGGGGGGSGAASNGSSYGGGGGGGGGSSYVESNARHVRNYQGWKTATGNGEVIITW